jgi:16S rRNA U516 pseudouridylate synthase RsuA-like enzyme
MLKAVGHPVVSLARIQIGPITAGGLKPGQWRALAPREVQRLRESAHELNSRN